MNKSQIDRQIRKSERALLAWGFEEGTPSGIYRKTVVRWGITVQSPRASSAWGSDHWVFRIRDLDALDDSYEFAISGTVSMHKSRVPLESILEHLLFKVRVKMRDEMQEKIAQATKKFIDETKYL